MNCIERNSISGNSDDYMKYYVMIVKELTELLLEETMKHEHYYKNILTEESFDMFEKIVTFIRGGKRTIAIIGLDNIVIVDSDDALLVAAKGKIQDVKKVAEEIKGRSE